MGLKVPDRIHIAPVGYERDRVVEAAAQFKADYVILISHVDNDSTGDDWLEQVQEGLTNKNIEHTTKFCDIFDLYESLGRIAETIEEYEEEEVYVNISAGSKITAVAGAIASMVTDCTAYYAKAEDYDGEAIGIKDVTEIPHYPIDAPDENQTIVLEFVNRANEKGKSPTKGELIHFSESNQLGYMDRNVGGKGKYRLLDTHIIDPLLQKGYLKTVKEGRTIRVEITEEGKRANQAFRYLIDRSKYNWDPQSGN
ncbi:hypothetical protein G3A49_15850 [Haloferax volcanii]|uniref:CRISPR-associated protein n=1 Tax=Haloferax volcanii TaxID=2246 RepID=A0A6C0UVB5_HALVO|nr:DUF6293 family protein [Haloferax alexandrinus]NLV04097.1 hypothetical protein [Haloferax alexandrinus]QIB79495.1 hypothetical protein G3A49_15850 [Haloferax alexandrinus]